MQTRYGESPWIAAYPAAKPPSFPRLRGEHAADVVIVGAGLTGRATAVACAFAGMKPLVIEAERVGLAAGRTSGLLLPDPGPSFRDIAKRHGLRVAKLVFGTWRRGGFGGGGRPGRAG